MAGASSAAGPDAGSGWRWDVALSFAGAQRDYVEQVAQALQAQGVRCFYDADEQIELWGKYLAEELPAIYGEQAAAIVVFISAEYAARDWTRLERRAALARAVRERREYVLPARFDDTPLPGLLSDMVTVDLRGRTPQQFAAMISGKLAALAVAAPSAGAGESARDVESARPAGTVRVGEADPRRLGVHAAISDAGRSLTLNPGDVVIVEVEENLGTGYSWAVVDDGGVLSQIESTQIPAPQQLMGAPGTHRFRFSAARAGTGTLELHLRRPWESARAPAERLRLPITVG